MGEATEGAPQESVQAAAPTKRPVWKQRLWLAGRVGATVGAVGFALAAWAFFVRVSDGTQALNLNPGDVDTAYWGGYFWASYTVLGMLALPLIWLATSSVGKECSVLFLIMTASFAVGFSSNVSNIVFSKDMTLTLVDGLTPHSLMLVQSPQVLPGYMVTIAAGWFLVAGAALSAISLLLLGSDRRLVTTRPEQASTSTRRRLPGAGWLTLGLVVFLLGILEMGWAAVNCTATPLFVGQCNGLSFSGVLHYGIATHTDAFDPVAALYAIPTLLVGGAALALVGVWWWRRLTPGLCLWITLYLAVATFFFVVAYAGVGAIVAEASALGLQAGRWTGQIGIVIAGVGLVIGWGAAVVLWVWALRPARPEAAVQPTG